MAGERGDTGRVVVSMREIMCEETSGEQGGKHNHLLHCSAASSKNSRLGDWQTGTSHSAPYRAAKLQAPTHSWMKYLDLSIKKDA